MIHKLSSFAIGYKMSLAWLDVDQPSYEGKVYIVLA